MPRAKDHSGHFEINRWKDEPSKRLGSAHRKERHGPQAAAEAYGKFGTAGAIQSGFHDIEDRKMIFSTKRNQ